MAIPQDSPGTPVNRHHQAYRKLHKDNDPDGALTLLSEILNEDPDDPLALSMSGEVLARAHRYGLANALYRRVLQLDRSSAHAWNNLGHALHTVNRIPEASAHFLEAIRQGGESFDSMNNLMLMNVVSGDHAKALKILNYALFHAGNQEEKRGAYSSASLSYLAIKDWERGWPAFECMLDDVKQRKRRQFVNDMGEKVPDWNGKPVDGNIAVYGEQGLGDEVMFSSMIPDMIRAGHKPVIECDHRLQRLFQRSFACPVFGTRNVKGERKWDKGLPIRAKVAIGSLAQFFRSDPSQFTRGPFLSSCPIRGKHIASVLAKMPGLKVGLTWTGGLPSTRGADRSLDLAQLEPLFRIPNVTYFSLEYKGPKAPEPIVDWHEFTRSSDYDDTAALINSLDMVVSVTTATALVAGALGKECLVMVPEHPTWHWGVDGDMPWFDSLRLYRRKGLDWAPVVAAIAARIQDRCDGT